MHDLFEGVVATELQLFLTHCVQSRFFPITLLNSRMARYDFPNNKPSPIESACRIHQSASQLMTLIIELPMKYNSNVVSPNVELGLTKSDCTLAREPKHT